MKSPDLHSFKARFQSHVNEHGSPERSVFTLKKPLHAFKVMHKAGHNLMLANVIIPEGATIRTNLYTDTSSSGMEVLVMQANRMFVYSLVDPEQDVKVRRAKSADDPRLKQGSVESPIPYKVGKIAYGDNLLFSINLPERFNAYTGTRTRRNAVLGSHPT